MSDDELRAMFQDIRQHVDAKAAETQEHFDVKAAEMKEHLAAHTAEVSHKFEITTERLRHEIGIVAEGVLALDQKMERRFADLNEHFDEAFTAIDRRVRVLEGR